MLLTLLSVQLSHSQPLPQSKLYQLIVNGKWYVVVIRLSSLQQPVLISLQFTLHGTPNASKEELLGSWSPVQALGL